MCPKKCRKKTKRNEHVVVACWTLWNFHANTALRSHQQMVVVPVTLPFVDIIYRLKTFAKRPSLLPRACLPYDPMHGRRIVRRQNKRIRPVSSELTELFAIFDRILFTLNGFDAFNTCWSEAHLFKPTTEAWNGCLDSESFFFFFTFGPAKSFEEVFYAPIMWENQNRRALFFRASLELWAACCLLRQPLWHSGAATSLFTFVQKASTVSATIVRNAGSRRWKRVIVYTWWNQVVYHIQLRTDRVPASFSFLWFISTIRMFRHFHCNY